MVAIAAVVKADIKPSLKDELKEILNELPMDKIRSYMETDENLKGLAESFGGIWGKFAEKLSEYSKDFTEFLQIHGINVQTTFDNFLQIQPQPNARYDGETINKEIGQNLPRVISIYFKKMNQSPQFREFIGKLLSSNNNELLNELRQSPEFKEMMESPQAKEAGFEEILEDMYEMFGWKKP